MSGKIVIATRSSGDSKDIEACVDNFRKYLNDDYSLNLIERFYIIGKENGDREIGDRRVILIRDPKGKPTRATSFNLVIEALKRNESKETDRYHLLTFSKEVDLQYCHIKRMRDELEKNKNLIVVGYRLKDNVCTDEELKIFSNGKIPEERGIAYQVPWNTCALWNNKFVNGSGNKELNYDEMCESNQLDRFCVKIRKLEVFTEYQGMEDGLAIAKLVTINNDLKYKLFDEEIPWKIDNNAERINNQKVKLARKNIVLSTFMNIKGYSIGKLVAAKS